MKEYGIAPMTAPLPTLTGKVFDPEAEPFCKGNAFAAIAEFAWRADYPYAPEARAYVTWSEAGLQVLLCAKEAEIHVDAEQFNGEVYKDSCLEFFVQPFEDDPRYINIETNAHGVALIGVGADRYSRALLEKMPQDMNLTASKHEGGWWAVSYSVTNAMIESIFGRKIAAGQRMRGNFYKCAETFHPHFGSWSPIQAPAPDFHRPEFFSGLTILTVL